MHTLEKRRLVLPILPIAKLTNSNGLHRPLQEMSQTQRQVHKANHNGLLQDMQTAPRRPRIRPLHRPRACLQRRLLLIEHAIPGPDLLVLSRRRQNDFQDHLRPFILRLLLRAPIRYPNFPNPLGCSDYKNYINHNLHIIGRDEFLRVSNLSHGGYNLAQN